MALCGNGKCSHIAGKTDVVTLQTSLGSDFPVDETKEQKTIQIRYDNLLTNKSILLRVTKCRCSKDLKESLVTKLLTDCKSLTCTEFFFHRNQQLCSGSKSVNN